MEELIRMMDDCIKTFESRSFEFCITQYNIAKEYAQNDEWDKHLTAIQPVIVIYSHYKAWDKVARCLCRGAWSYIAKKEVYLADQWLIKAIKLDQVEGLAGLYWAIEYSKRFGRDDCALSKKWRTLFREQAGDFLYKNAPSHMSDQNMTDISIAFYQYLTKRNKPAESDFGRYNELIARSTKITYDYRKKIHYFEIAARYYNSAKLKKYENFCLLCAEFELLFYSNLENKNMNNINSLLDEFIKNIKELTKCIKLDDSSVDTLNSLCQFCETTLCHELDANKKPLPKLANELTGSHIFSEEGRKIIEDISYEKSPTRRREGVQKDDRYFQEQIFDLLEDYYKSILAIY